MRRCSRSACKSVLSFVDQRTKHRNRMVYMLNTSTKWGGLWALSGGARRVCKEGMQGCPAYSKAALVPRADGVGALRPGPARVLWLARQMPAPTATRSRETHIERRPSTSYRSFFSGAGRGASLALRPLRRLTQSPLAAAILPHTSRDSWFHCEPLLTSLY